MTSPTLREQVARIIDPEAFEADPEVFATRLWGSATPGRTASAVALLGRRNAAALAKADAILALPNGWQDISFAPVTTHHMKPILAFWRGRGVQQTYWDVDDDFRDRPRGWRSPESGWRCDGDQCIPVNQEDVTHWRPLPDPPKPSDREA